MKRRFRYDPDSKEMVEIPLSDDFAPTIGIQGEIEPFRSPVDGTIIRSKRHLADYMAEKGLRLKEPGSDRKVEDRYAKPREQQELRERLYEGVDRMMRRTDVRKFLRTRR